MKQKPYEDIEGYAERIKKVRKQHGYTQEKMAEMLSISLSAYKKIESSENNISLKGLTILKEKFDISTDYILYGECGQYKECWHLFNNCTEGEKLKLFIRMLLYFSDEAKTHFVFNDMEEIEVDDLLNIVLASKRITRDKNYNNINKLND